MLPRRLEDLLCPHEYLESLEQVDLEALRARGIRGLIVDLDNTLVHWEQHQAGPELVRWVGRARELGLGCCILTNNHRAARIAAFAAELGAAFVARAGKPRRRPFRAAMRALNTTPETTVVIGDQVFTDVLGGRRAGLYTILVRPRSPREFVGTRLLRALERKVLAHLERRGRLAGTTQSE